MERFQKQVLDENDYMPMVRAANAVRTKKATPTQALPLQILKQGLCVRVASEHSALRRDIQAVVLQQSKD